MSGEGTRDHGLGVISPSPTYVVDAFLDLAKISESDVVYDLGCNDGRVVVAAAGRRQARCVGIEQDPGACAKAKDAVRQAGLGKLVQIRHENALEADLKNATVVYLYLSPSGLKLLEPKLRELSPDVKVITYLFKIPTWDDFLVEVKGATSQKTLRMDVSGIARLYRYNIPPKEDGRHKQRWKLCGLVSILAMALVKVLKRTLFCPGRKRLQVVS